MWCKGVSVLIKSLESGVTSEEIFGCVNKTLLKTSLKQNCQWVLLKIHRKQIVTNCIHVAVAISNKLH